ncbi:MAG: ABC transporter ATP-binding protein/permease [Desulfobulbaceae bacterium]|jgi:ATP-binding cassette subfamily B protein|nr:ABC transporter ATP-binding protein/permease [Desulfobulbaceae bacterium]
MNAPSTSALLWRFAAPGRKTLAASVALAVAGVACGMVPYFAVSAMVVDLYVGAATAGGLTGLALVALLGQIGRVALGTASTIFSHRAAFASLADIRISMAEKLARMPLGGVLETPSGALKTLIVDTVEKMETPLAHLIPELISNLFIPFCMACYLFWLDWRLALLALVTFPLGLLCYMGMTKDYAKYFSQAQNAGKEMNTAIVEYINGIEVIKMFNQTTSSYEKYAQAVKANREALQAWFRATNLYYVVGMAIAPASLLTVLPTAVYFHMSGSLAAPTAVTCVILSLGLIQPIILALGYTDSLAMMDGVLKETASLLDREEMARPLKPAALQGCGVAFDQVSFSYKKDAAGEALHEVSFAAVEGGVTAIVGPSGSGKSTLAKLLVSFWEADSGRVLLGGVDARLMPLEQVMNTVAYVAQENFLFDCSLRENIRLGKPEATDAAVEAAAQAASCGFIAQLPQGFDTLAGDAGTRLSGGERQRVAIARAMLKNAPIVVLDEATAYADPENEAVIQESINRLVRNKTLIVIAHRLTTIICADRIVVMEEGQVAAIGKHEKLLASSNLYRRLWQASGEGEHHV